MGAAPVKPAEPAVRTQAQGGFRLPARVSVEPRADADVYIVSYPKAGRTWLNALLGRYLVDRYRLPEAQVLATPWLTARAGLARTAFYHDRSDMLNALRACDLPTDKSEYRGKRVVLLGRDVRDIAVSAYFQATRRIGVFAGPIADFVRHEIVGVDKILTFYRIWHDNRGVPSQLLFLRYEDMHRDPAAALRRVLSLMGVTDIDDEAVNAAAEACRFERLREAEARGTFASAQLRPGADADPESFKVRKGKVANFAEYLSADDIRYIDSRVAALGTPFTPAWNAVG